MHESFCTPREKEGLPLRFRMSVMPHVNFTVVSFVLMFSFWVRSLVTLRERICDTY